METFPALLAICAGNSQVTSEFPAQRPVVWSFDVFFNLRLNKRLNKQSGGWWFESPLHPLWRHSNVIDFIDVTLVLWLLLTSTISKCNITVHVMLHNSNFWTNNRHPISHPGSWVMVHIFWVLVRKIPGGVRTCFMFWVLLHLRPYLLPSAAISADGYCHQSLRLSICLSIWASVHLSVCLCPSRMMLLL